MAGQVTILAPNTRLQVFTWKPNDAIRGAAAQAQILAVRRAKQSVKSTNLGNDGAVLLVLAQYAAAGLLTATHDSECFAAASLYALYSQTNKTDFVFTLNQSGQVTKVESK
jgi:hypothetical protein